MFVYKTKYTLENLEEVMISDAGEFSFPKIGRAGSIQLEMFNPMDVIKQKNIKELMAKVYPGVENTFLILQDLKEATTTIFSESDKLLELLKNSGIPGEREGNYWKIDHIMMRKSIIPYLKK